MFLRCKKSFLVTPGFLFIQGWVYMFLCDPNYYANAVYVYVKHRDLQWGYKMEIGKPIPSDYAEKFEEATADDFKSQGHIHPSPYVPPELLNDVSKKYNLKLE
jgi:hypothetical protein